MQTKSLLIAMWLVGCAHAQTENRTAEIAQARLAAVSDAILPQLSAPWDGGEGIDRLIGDLRYELRINAVRAVRFWARESSAASVPAKAHARKWLAVKGYK